MAHLPVEDLDLPVLTLLAARAAEPWLLEATGVPGVRTLHGYVVQHLVDGRPTVTELAGALGVSQQAASKWVAELEGLGLAARRSDPHDGRTRRVELTARGRGLVRRARRARADLAARVAARVGADDVAAATRTLAALLDEVGATEAVRRRSVPAPTDS